MNKIVYQLKLKEKPHPLELVFMRVFRKFGDVGFCRGGITGEPGEKVVLFLFQTYVLIRFLIL